MLQISALILVLILVIYILTAHYIVVKRIRFLHESVVAILMGIITATILKYGFAEEVHFDPELFFNLLLPAIIFAAGYNLHRKHFFDNFFIIAYHGIICTILTFVILSLFAVLFNEWNLTDVKLGDDEILLLTATLCATDTVAALTLVKESQYPVLNSVLFGEGIFNDAVSILLFRSVKKYLSENSSFSEVKYDLSQISITISLEIFLDFNYLLIVSLIVGIVLGGISALLFKYCDSIVNQPIKETSLILLLGYASYLVSEWLHLSGILSLFCCGVIMAVYTYPNISQEAQQGTQLAFDTVGYLAEAFVFAYLGITTLQIPISAIPWTFSILLILAMAFARFFTIFLLPCVFHVVKKPFSLSVKELQIVWYSGLIRGVIAFALAMTISTSNAQIIQGSVLFIVLLTTCVGSILLESFSACIGMKEPEDSLYLQFQEFMIDGKSKEDLSVYHEIGEKRQKSEPTVEYNSAWQKFEKKLVQPLFQKKKPVNVEPAEPSMYQMQSF